MSILRITLSLSFVEVKMRIIFLLCVLLTSQSVSAGAIIHSTKSIYQVGDIIQFDVSYWEDDPQSFTEVSDFDLLLSYSPSLASFKQFSFAQPYSSDAWISYYDEASYTGSSLLWDISINPFAEVSKNSWDLFSVSFIADDVGLFDFSLSYLDIYDYNLNFIDSVNSFKQIEIVSAKVSEPSMVFTFFLILTGLFFIRSRSVNA